jgi:hypothetical protein
MSACGCKLSFTVILGKSRPQLRKAKSSKKRDCLCVCVWSWLSRVLCMHLNWLFWSHAQHSQMSSEPGVIPSSRYYNCETFHNATSTCLPTIVLKFLSSKLANSNTIKMTSFRVSEDTVLLKCLPTLCNTI